MPQDTSPIVVAFDGSEVSQAAVRAAAALFGERPVVVVSVWEPGLAMAVTATPDVTGLAYPLPTPEQIRAVDDAQRDHATVVAQAGVHLLQELGATAEALPVAESVDVAETLVALAEERDAAAIVIGSRGLGGVKAMFGSTSRQVLDDTRRPVLVVRAPH